MNRLINPVLFSLLCMIHAFNSYGQQTDCAAMYEQTTKKILEPSKGMRVLEYGVKIVEKKASKENKENRIKVYCDSSHRYIITDYVQIYMDYEHSVMLVPTSKSIMVNYTDAKGKKSLKEPQADFADSLFRSAVQISSCKEVTGNELYDREMIIKPKSNKADFVQSVYWIKSTEQRIYKITLTYNKGEHDRVEYTFYKDDKGLPNDKINKPVIGLFFKKNGSLLPAYQGYRVTDNRNISSKN